jgi:deazaflavin-dependent oxidoreductase (nitroreductase family)
VTLRPSIEQQNKEVVAAHRAARGRLVFNGMPIALLTTTGRSTGRPVITPVAARWDGPRVVFCASAGGRPRHPGWYLNIAAQLRIGVAFEGVEFETIAHVSPRPRTRTTPRPRAGGRPGNASFTTSWRDRIGCCRSSLLSRRTPPEGAEGPSRRDYSGTREHPMTGEAWDTTARVAARTEVRATIDAYALCDGGLVDAAAALFTDDGVLEAPEVGVLVRGREAIRQPWWGSPPDSRRQAYRRSAPSATMSRRVALQKLTQARARATSYYVVLTEVGVDHWGSWVDVLVPERPSGGKWLLAEHLSPARPCVRGRPGRPVDASAIVSDQ